MRTPILTAALLIIAACGGSEPAAPPAPEKAAVEAPKAEEKPAEAPKAEPEAAAATGLTPDAEGIVRLEANDQMKYNADRIEVTGTEVKIELKHVGQAPAATMGHNVVILKPGTDPMAWAGTAVGAANTNYVPEGDAAVIAHSKVLGGGESETIEFTLPGPGEYPFVCSFPGHAALMKGVLVAK